MAWALAASMSAAARCRGSRPARSGAGASWSRFSASAAWRASSMMRPASALASASWAWYSVEHALGLGLGRLGRVEVGADPLGAGLHALLDRRAAELPDQERGG